MDAGLIDTRIERALNWARRHFDYSAHEVIRDVPWGVTLRLTKAETSAYLKLFPKAQARLAASVAAIANLPTGAMARVIAHDASAGFLLSEDHGGRTTNNPDSGTLMALLTTGYAQIQALAAEQLDLLAAVPKLNVVRLLDDVADFLGPRRDYAEARAHYSDFVGIRQAVLAAEAFSISRSSLEFVIRLADHLPPTLNHCDLHDRNVAMDDAGACKFHDWDNAMIGPPGLSLGSMTGTVAELVRWQVDGRPETGSEAVGHLLAYLEALEGAGYPTVEDLLQAVIGAALAGLLVRLVNYRPYRPQGEDERQLCVDDLRAIVDDLLETVQVLAGQDTAQATALAGLWSRHKHYEKLLDLVNRSAFGLGVPLAEAHLPDLTSQTEIGYVTRLARAYRRAWEPDTVPVIETDLAERFDQGLFALQAKVATKIFEEQGTLAIANAFPPALLSRCLAQYLAIGGSASGKPLQVGDKRFMEGLSVQGAFNQPEIYAQPLLMKMFETLLGKDFVIGSMTLVVSQPGSQTQHLHIDHPHLFGGTGIEVGMPPHAVTVLIPLVDIDELIGGTEVIKGSHRVPYSEGADLPRQRQTLSLGSCLMFDYRLFHGGLPNRSKRNRPVLSIVYHRSWFADTTNFNKLHPLQVPKTEYDAIPDQFRPLFANAEIHSNT
ncbi:phytanoyl-CoA dioxygenase family protein [Rhabdaerophilum sp. SD176]|uniref:phytanoyl-CoA dioxygenase family protein n=1 Tax=Rhabdaerophilum sp. SD176 TaxID=2983548 RepID=UPI0024DFD6A9|nr:phytanoyl-CoA dioxygenase family protein [Rhabdaerophilum sp. SD176]